ncbi:MAG: anthranilate synthase component II [Acidimicrobiia bacterium]
MGARVLVIDNYDSFVFNLVQYLGELGAQPIVRRNDEIDLAGVEALDPDAILISPGPGTPDQAGISCELIRHWAGRRPILGVCLGHQAIGEVFGGDVVRAEQVMHGKTSPIQHDGSGVFAGLPQPFEATRYHSLVVDPTTLPDVLEVTAWTDPEVGAGRVIMGLRHRDHDVEGVQFHPESILTGTGHQILQRFLDRVASATPEGAPAG